MVDRIFRPIVVDDESDIAEAAVAHFNSLSLSTKFPFPILAKARILTKTNQPFAEGLVKEQGDAYVVDQRFKIPGLKGHSKDGLTIAEQIRAAMPHVPIILYTGQEQRTLFDPVTKALENGIISAVAIKGTSDESRHVVTKLRDHALKPLTVGIIGHGDFAQKLTGLCVNNPSIVSQVSVYSRHMAEKPESSQEAFDRKGKGRLTFKQDLESLINDQPDILIITSSAGGRLKDKTKVFPKDKDFARLSLFEQEIDLQKNIWEVITRLGYEGVVLNPVNPPSGGMEIGVREGFDKYRIALPYDPNVTRVVEAFADNIQKKEYLNRLSSNHPSLLLSLLKDIEGVSTVGPHGMPMVGITANFENSLYNTGFSKNEVAAIKREINEIPPLSWNEGMIQAQLEMDTGVSIAQAAQDTFAWLVSTAKYKNPKRNVICFDEDFDSYCGLPSYNRFTATGKMDVRVNHQYADSRVRREGIKDYEEGIDLRQLLLRHKTFFGKKLDAKGILR